MLKYKKSFKKGFIIFPVIVTIIIFTIAFFALNSISNYTKLIFAQSNVSFDTDSVEIFDVNNFMVPDSGTIQLTSKDFPVYNDIIGNITVENTDVNANVYFGDGTTALNNGVGISTGSFIPGYGRTVLVAGHNNTYFNGLKNAQTGNKIKIKTYYGDYIYEITDIKIVDESDSTAYNLTAAQENLIMYTCYPFDTLGLTSKRFFVYGKFISGPKIVIDE